MLLFRDRHPEQDAARTVRDDELQPESFRRVQGELPIRVQDALQSGMEVRQIDPLTVLGHDILVADVKEKARHAVFLSRIACASADEDQG